MELILLFVLVVALIAAGVWIGLALAGASVIALSLFLDVNVTAALAFSAWSGLAAAELAPLPLFVLMGEILLRGGVAQGLFRSLGPLMARLPGGLVQVNILGCTLLAAASGSSAATTATIGRITVKELAARRYDRSLAMGSLCGAGTLGFLIPPSIILILYGVLAEVSILDLFLAGIVPGLLLALLFMVYVAIAGGRGHADPQQPLGWQATLAALGPVIVLILTVLGSLYAGLATPTESAVIGVAGALLVARWQGRLGRDGLLEAFAAAVRTSAMIGLVLLGALFLSRTAVYLDLPGQVAALVAPLADQPIALILLLMLVYALLGMILDGLSLVVMTLPVAGPLVAAAGFDPLWFGIFLVIVVEMGQITPPLGFNLFIVQALTGERLSRIAWASLPFFIILSGFALILALVPGLALWLPGRL
ncbi:MAG: TRAP transporter large permease [Rhodothalassiaceae bacterium]